LSHYLQCANTVVVFPGSTLLKSYFKKENNLCTTPECIHASSEILYNLSPNYQSIDPCSEQLEEMICGGWRERHDLRPDQGDAFTGTMMAESSQMLLRHILEAPYPENSQVRFVSQLNNVLLTFEALLFLPFEP
jgi:hypothetical protein